MVAAARWRELARRDHRYACEHANVEAGVSQAPLASPGIRAHVLGEVDDVAAERRDLGDNVAAPDDQRATERAQRLVEIPERVEEERDAIRRAERLEDRVVEHEQRQHALALLARCMERRVVVDAEVAREEDDPGAHPIHASHRDTLRRRAGGARRLR